MTTRFSDQTGRGLENLFNLSGQSSHVTSHMATIESIIRQRDDLSALIIHLSRDTQDATAAENLASILKDDTIKAVTPFGRAVLPLSKKNRNHPALPSQRCVCFTETPIQHVGLLTGKIEGRENEFQPYGIAITRKTARVEGVNPVWYVDITPGHTWLTEYVDQMIADAINHKTIAFKKSHIAKIAPFIEAMGKGAKVDGGGYRREFWWEREWRHIGDYHLPSLILGFCPAKEIDEFRKIAKDCERPDLTFVDPTWDAKRIKRSLPEDFLAQVQAL